MIVVIKLAVGVITGVRVWGLGLRGMRSKSDIVVVLIKEIFIGTVRVNFAYTCTCAGISSSNGNRFNKSRNSNSGICIHKGVTV